MFVFLQVLPYENVYSILKTLMSFLFMETYITLLINFVKMC
jgi:hypothetical protein